jgi:putative nucleotidyltransferase with HDIG domain
MVELPSAEKGLGRPAAGVSAVTPLARLVSATRAIAAEPIAQRMLRIASRELTLMLSAEACLISRLDDGILREVADYSASEREVARSFSYYVSDYPATAAVLDSRVACSISTADPSADAAEVFVLREMDMEAVLLVPLTVEARSWGLIEIYDARPRAFSGLERQIAELAASHISARIAGFEHAESAEQLYRETLASLSNALEEKDRYTSAHTEEVVRLAIAVAAELGLGGDVVRIVELGAVLHDIGKVRVPEAILNKPGSLDEAEWEIMKTHPEVGERILEPIKSLSSILPIVRHHHERWDGNGYPDRLAEQAIPLGARIVSVCDAYRAMTEDRPYRRALSDRRARRELEEGAMQQFDPDCVAALLEVLDRRAAEAKVVALRPPRQSVRRSSATSTG